MPLNATQAKTLVGLSYPEARIVDCFEYKDLFLVRIQHPSEEEADYDPFFSVNVNTGEVNEFSVIANGDPSGLAEAFEKGRR